MSRLRCVTSVQFPISREQEVEVAPHATPLKIFEKVECFLGWPGLGHGVNGATSIGKTLVLISHPTGL
jgi:hypothetical protein